MSTLTFPNIIPNDSEFGLQSNTQSARSDIWTGVFTFTNKVDPDARILRAFLTSLRGQAGRFYLSPPGYRKAGIGTGTPQVKGAGQTGSSLLTDGWTPSQTGILLAGDYFQYEYELKMMTADANSDSGGNATLNFTPPIRVSPADNATIITTKPSCVMMLKNGNQSRWQAMPTPIYAMSIACEEALV